MAIFWPDLTIASHGIVRESAAYSTTRGIDHFPILITLHGKHFRTRQSHTHGLVDLPRTSCSRWSDNPLDVLQYHSNNCAPSLGLSFHCPRRPSSKYAAHVNIKFKNISTSFKQAFFNFIQTARDSALEDIECDSSTPALHARMPNQRKRARTLTSRYAKNGKRHSDFVNLLRQYKFIQEYQRVLSTERWDSLCDKLGQERAKYSLLSSPTLKDSPTTVEHQLITTFFPYTSLYQHPPLPVIAIPAPFADLDSPITLAELQAALFYGKRRSALGHDDITWQHLRILDDSITAAL